MKVDIEAERRAKNDAVSSKLSIQEKSTAFIQQQQREIEKLHAEKVSEGVCKECTNSDEWTGNYQLCTVMCVNCVKVLVCLLIVLIAA